MRHCIFGWTVATCLLLSQTAESVTIRYALIIGNNIGVDSDGKQPFAPLTHAEREAALLRDSLVGLSNFDMSSQRTRLLLGATRKEVKAAVRALIKTKESDKKTFGQVDSLFLFYYTGHGLSGRLLLDDGPLMADEIGAFFTSFGADFSIGVFDACYAGSLDRAALASKGIHSAPGLNLFRELPDEVLSAEGSIWYVSSSRDQESYEDERLGGVFTHFFMEALERAPAAGPGITLDSIWQYTRSHTVDYTAQRKRLQVPEQYIARLRSSAPVYFSFPTARSSTLVLSEALEGRFALAYREGNLTEVFEKSKGVEIQLAVYPGQARLILVDSENHLAMRSIALKPKATLVLSTMREPAPPPSVGHHSRPLFEKGVGLENSVSAIQIYPGLSFLGGLGYRFDLADELLLHARHGLIVPLRFDIGNVMARLNFKYGYDERRYPAWAHSVHELGAKAAVGYAFDVRLFRLGLSAAVGFAYLRQEYTDGLERKGWQAQPSLELSALYPGNGRVQGELFADLGEIYAPGVGEGSENLWRFSFALGLSLLYRFY